MLDKIIHITVPEEFDGNRLDVFLTRMVDIIPSRAFASKLILHGSVTVDQKSQKPSLKLKINQCVSVDSSFLTQINPEPVGEKIPLSILFEDEHLIVIDKQVGMVVHPGAGVSSGTLVNAILGHCGSTLPSLGKAARAGIVAEHPPASVSRLRTHACSRR